MRPGARCWRVVAAVMLAAALSHATKQVTITVQDLPQQTFKGFGSNSHADPEEMPEHVKEKLVTVLWIDLDFTAMRFARVYHKWSIPYILADFEENIKLKQRLYAEHGKDSLILLFNPTGTTDNTEQWTEDIVNIIDSLNAHGIRCDYTGVGNEPNQHEHEWAAPIRPQDFPAIINGVRQKLDARGFSDIKIIAPEASNVDDYYWQSIEAIVSDEECVNNLDGFAFHSYNMSMIQPTWEWLREYGKELWQTESSHFTIDEHFNDSMVAAEMSAMFLADMNFGCERWLYWIDAGP
ncbi:MAG: hypothetical protein GF418_16725, partial [Chitinivibrionales bacterium]|nr:hypothetical protein [Chitinivibrionales bacterium]